MVGGGGELRGDRKGGVLFLKHDVALLPARRLKGRVNFLSLFADVDVYPFVSKNGTRVFCEGGGWGYSSDMDFEACFFAGLLTL